MKKKIDQIKTGAIISYFSVILNIVVTLLYTPWMIQKIGQSSYGIYSLATSLISVFLFDFGMSAAVSRFISKYRAEGKNEEIGGFLNLIFKLFIFFSLILLICFIVAYYYINQIYRGLTDEEIAIFKNLYIVVASYSVVSFIFTPLDGILNAYEEFIALKIVGLLQKVISVSLVIIALAINCGVYALVLSSAISGTIVIVVKIIIVINKVPRVFGEKYNSSLLKEVFSFSIWVAVMGIAQRLTFNLTPTILGIVSNSREIATFSPANMFESYYYTFAAAINGLFLPRVSRLLYNNEKNEIMALMVKIGKIQIFILGLIFVGFISIGKKFIFLWLGEQYNVSYYAAAILFIPDLLLFSQQIANTLMIADNKVKYTAIGYLIMGGVCVAFSIPLSSKFGCIGASAAISIGYFFYFVFVNYCYVKKMGLNMKHFYSECYTRPILSIIISIVLSVILLGFTKYKTSWLVLMLEGLIVTTIYVVVYYGIASDKLEKQIIYSNIINRIKSVI